MKKLFLIFCVFFLLTCCVSYSKFDYEKDGKILREACEITLPPDSSEEYEREIFKTHGGTISKHYTHEAGCPAVENHYQKVLNDRGWAKVLNSFFSNPDYIDFRKGELLISLTCSENKDIRGTKNFSISCSKGLR